MASKSIFSLSAIEVLDSRGNPSIYCTVMTKDHIHGSAMVPSGASTGAHEAHELRDGDQNRYNGKGVEHNVRLITHDIADVLKGQNILNQKQIDKTLVELDGTDTKSRLGANTVLAVSLAAARCAATYMHKPLYQYLRSLYWSELADWIVPVPLCNIINGGKHAYDSIDMQEFMIVPHGAPTYREAIRWSTEVHHALGKILKKKHYFAGVGDEGGYMPKLQSHRAALDLLVDAIAEAGYQSYNHIGIALDPAASELYQNGKYHLPTEGEVLSSEDLIAVYSAWAQKYPILSIEDGFAQDDWEGFKKLTQKWGDQMQIVGDDLFTTNSKRIQQGVDEGAANAVLIKPNQIGTLSETAEAISLAQKHNFNIVISHRSGETEDSFIADLAVASNAGQLKSGAPHRSERLAKYNRLLIIEHSLRNVVRYAQPFS